MSNDISRDMVITKKILAEIADIELFLKGISEEDYYADMKTQKAVVMTLINIGELVKLYTEAFVSEHKKIPWKKIQAMRNVAAHKYEAVEVEIVWDTIQISIPELKKELASVSIIKSK